MQRDDFFKKLLDNLYDGVYFVDKDRKITVLEQGRGAHHRIRGR